jgi:hypothetical protein
MGGVVNSEMDLRKRSYFYFFEFRQLIMRCPMIRNIGVGIVMAVAGLFSSAHAQDALTVKDLASSSTLTARLNAGPDENTRPFIGASGALANGWTRCGLWYPGCFITGE